MREFIKTISAALMALTIIGCSDNNEAIGEPPVSGIALLTEMYQNLELKKYDIALGQFNRYNSATESSVVLEGFELTIIANAAIQEAQKLVDKGEFEEAMSVLQSAKLSNPLNVQISSAYNEIYQLVEIRKAITSIIDAKVSDEIVEPLEFLQIIMAEESEFRDIEPVITQGEAKLKKLTNREELLTRTNVIFTAGQLNVESNVPMRDLLYSQYLYEQQKSKELQLSKHGVEDVALGKN